MNPKNFDDSPASVFPKLRKKWLKWLGWGAIFAFTLIVLAYALVNWYGARAWNAYVAKAKASGERIEPSAFIPPPVPDEENFAAIPFFKPLFDYKMSIPSGTAVSVPVYRDPAGRERLNKLGIIQTKKSREVNPATLWPPGNSREGKLQDLAPLEKYFREEFGLTGEPVNPAEEVLRVLAKFDSDLDSLRAAAARPYSRYPVHYEEGIFAMKGHIMVLLRLGQILQLRTRAELSLGRTDAAAKDLLLQFRLNEAVATEPSLLSFMFRVTEVAATMPGIWEGVARHQWNDIQLVAFDDALARIDLISGYRAALRSERSLVAFPLLDAARTDRRLLASLVRKDSPFQASHSDGMATTLAYSLMPKGWIDLNKAATGNIFDSHLADADPVRHRFFPEIAFQNDANAYNHLFGIRNLQFGLARMLIFGFKDKVSFCADVQSEVTLTRVSIALERSRLAHGKYPESLEGLVPAFLPEIPHDVGTGKPIIYRRKGDASFALYSGNQNSREDDAGNLTWDHVWKTDSSPD